MDLSEFDDKLERREEIISVVKKLQTEQKQIEQEVKLAMGDNETAVSGHYRISWGNVDSVRIDSKRMKAEMPEIYSSFAKVSHARRFEIKYAGSGSEAASYAGCNTAAYAKEKNNGKKPDGEAA